MEIKNVIIYMKKLLDSDWPRAAQFKCNTSAISENRAFSKPMISRKMMTKILCGNFEKRCLE